MAEYIVAEDMIQLQARSPIMLGEAMLENLESLRVHSPQLAA